MVSARAYCTAAGLVCRGFGFCFFVQFLSLGLRLESGHERGDTEMLSVSRYFQVAQRRALQPTLPAAVYKDAPGSDELA